MTWKKELNKILKELGIPNEPGAYIINVAHDDWCEQLKGTGECNCDPDIEVVDVEGLLHEMTKGKETQN